jgi:hypothetical protein
MLQSTGAGAITTERVSVSSAGVQGDSPSSNSSISFLHDRSLGTTERVSLTSGGGEGNGASMFPSIAGLPTCRT